MKKSAAKKKAATPKTSKPRAPMAERAFTKAPAEVQARANPYRGEAMVEINGREIKFVLNIGALADLCAAFGTKSNLELFGRLSGPSNEAGEPQGPALSDVPAIACALSGGMISIEEARAYNMSEMAAVMRGIGRATSLAFPQESGSKKDGAALTTS